MYEEKLLPPLPAPCPLLPVFMIWLNGPKLQKEKAKPSKLLFLHLVTLTPFWGFPTGSQTLSTSDAGNTAHCSSWAHMSWVLLHSEEDDFKACPVRHHLEMVFRDFPHGKQCLQCGQSETFYFNWLWKWQQLTKTVCRRKGNPMGGKMRKSVTMEEWPVLVDCFFL